MNEQKIQKSILDATEVLSCRASSVTPEELDEAMLALGDLRKRGGETAAACLARLVADRDADMITLSKAKDLLECAGARAESAFKKRVADASFREDAETALNEHVELHKRAGEDLSTAYARLACDKEPGFVRLFNHLRNVQDNI